jgi:hypothetical protein
VTVTPLALDGVDYVVALWRGDVQGHRGLPALQALAAELDAELLDGEISGGEIAPVRWGASGAREGR